MFHKMFPFSPLQISVWSLCVGGNNMTRIASGFFNFVFYCIQYLQARSYRVRGPRVGNRCCARHGPDDVTGGLRAEVAQKRSGGSGSPATRTTRLHNSSTQHVNTTRQHNTLTHLRAPSEEVYRSTMDEDILTTLKLLIIGESGVGKSRLGTLASC